MTQTLPSVRYTHEFVRASLSESALRVLEIGCGSGELAALLMADGMEVIALDADPECAAKAQALGVDARAMRWPAPLGERFDAVLFTRSLHHVDDLPGSIEAARNALNAGGRIIVEDFRAEGGDKRSARWFSGLASILQASGALSPGASLEELLRKAAPSTVHDHHLHTSTEIARELGTFKSVTESDSAYYFRYLEPDFREPGAAQELLDHEIEMIAQGSIDAFGKRFVAQA